MAKRLTPDVAAFKRCKGRIQDLYQHMGDAIRDKRTVMMAANVLTDLQFLAGEIARLTAALGGEVSKDVAKVTKFVDRICEEQAPAVKGGQFVNSSAAIFKTYRLLVRELEQLILTMLDPDDAADLKVERTEIKEVNRIELDVADILDPDDAELAKA